MIRRRVQEGRAQQTISTRQQQRDARVYAERVYQALREWQTSSDVGEFIPGGGSRPSKSSRMQVVGIGRYGGTPCAALHATRLHLPHGQVSERATAVLCNADPLLDRIRQGVSPATLLRENGTFGYPGNRTRAYALAVLRLSTRLGDVTAEQKLACLATVEEVGQEVA